MQVHVVTSVCFSKAIRESDWSSDAFRSLFCMYVTCQVMSFFDIFCVILCFFFWAEETTSTSSWAHVEGDDHLWSATFLAFSLASAHPHRSIVVEWQWRRPTSSMERVVGIRNSAWDHPTYHTSYFHPPTMHVGVNLIAASIQRIVPPNVFKEQWFFLRQIITYYYYE